MKKAVLIRLGFGFVFFPDGRKSLDFVKKNDDGGGGGGGPEGNVESLVAAHREIGSEHTPLQAAVLVLALFFVFRGSLELMTI